MCIRDRFWCCYLREKPPPRLCFMYVFLHLYRSSKVLRTATPSAETGRPPTRPPGSEGAAGEHQPGSLHEQPEEVKGRHRAQENVCFFWGVFWLHTLRSLANIWPGRGGEDGPQLPLPPWPAGFMASPLDMQKVPGFVARSLSLSGAICKT